MCIKLYNRFLSVFVFLVIVNLNGFSQEYSSKITLEDIWSKGTFRGTYPNSIIHLKNGIHYCTQDEDVLNVYEYKSGKFIKKLVDLKTELVIDGKSIDYEDFTFSKDETKLLISTNSEPIYRHSSKSTYYVYNLIEKKIYNISKIGKLMSAEISPDGNKVAFVRENNLFYYNLNDNSEHQITFDGKINEIIYGLCDWVYEEEFSFSKAYFWSSDSKKIAFYRFDESKVKEYQMPTYGTTYPEMYTYKYPKAGEDNSIVSVHIFDILSNNITKADIGTNTDQYIPRIQWTNNPEIISIQRMNRLQNKLELLLCTVKSGSTEVVYTEENKYYIDITDDLRFLKDGKSFLITSEKDGYNHIYIYGFDGKLKQQITSGKWDVTAFINIDEEKSIIYYSSSEASPINQPIYTICYKNNQLKKSVITDTLGTFSADFNANSNYFIRTYSNANTPPKTDLCDYTGKLIRNINNNDALQETMKKYNFSKKEFFQFKTSNGNELIGWMIKPPSMKYSIKHPVLIYFYGGPGSQTVQNSWGRSDFIWFEMLAQMGYIIVSVDNRGTGARGEEFKKCTYLQLGKYETEDQIEVAKYLSSLSYIDLKRIGVFGWSYGGYLSSLCMTKGADYFKAGIAVAPVINWRNYDNIYTERFMRTPKENAAGYDDNSPINFASKLKGKYLLIHGSSDDNVHLQNSMEMADALVKNNIPFDMHIYTNKNHSIYGGKTRLHLYTKMTNFIVENL